MSCSYLHVTRSDVRRGFDPLRACIRAVRTDSGRQFKQWGSVEPRAIITMSENVQVAGPSSQPFQPFRSIEGVQAEIDNRSDN